MNPDWLDGAWDVHVHCAPSLFPRWGDGRDLAAACGRWEMGGVVIKAHHGSSVELAASLDRREGVRVLGGLVLNRFVGGLNALAVEAWVALGARVVWLPTIHAAHHGEVMGLLGGFGFQNRPFRHTPSEGIRIVGADGSLMPEMHDILDVLDGGPAVLATGHVAAQEILALKGAIDARKLDVRLLVNHVLFQIPELTDEQIAALVSPRVWLELCWFTVLHGVAASRVAATIEAHPRARWVLASDSGQKTTPPSPEALSAFCEALHGEGVPEKRIRRAVTEEPVRMLGVQFTRRDM